MFLGQFRQMVAQGEKHGESQESLSVKKLLQAETSEEKAASAEEFLKLPETKSFIKEWSDKTRDGRPIYTKRGVSLLLRLLYPNFGSNSKVRDAAREVLAMLGGMDGLQGFLMGWKAKSEGIIKVLKNVFG